MEELKRELLEQAKACGVCEEYYELMRSAGLSDLLKMYKNGMDFVTGELTGKPFLTNDFIKERFNRKTLLENLIFVDEVVKMPNGVNGTYILNGACRASVSLHHFAAARLYIRHESVAEIEAEGLSRVFIDVYDSARVTVRQKDAAKVFVYTHGEDCHVDISGDVKIRAKN